MIAFCLPESYRLELSSAARHGHSGSPTGLKTELAAELQLACLVGGGGDQKRSTFRHAGSTYARL